MKELIIIIRPEKLEDVKDVLEVGAKVADAVDKTIKLIDKFNK